MEKKTDMTPEFGRHDPGAEFSRPTEDQTDRAPEFNHPPDRRRAEYYCAGDQEKEFCRQGESPAYRTGRERKRRGLLLQMACVALSVVLVSSSFGVDILGGDLLFSPPSSGTEEVPSPTPSDPTPTPPDPPTQGGQEQYPSQEDQHPSLEGIADPPSIYVTLSRDAAPVFIVSGGQLTLEGLGLSDLSYDPDTNTLTLDDFRGDTICANRMGEDFTIYLKGDNSVNAIYSYGDPSSANGSLTIDGDYEAELSVNMNQINPVGIQVFAEGGSSTLWIEPGLGIDVKGSHSAVLVSDTTAADGIDALPCVMTPGPVSNRPSERIEGTSDWFYANPDTPSASLSYVTFRLAFSTSYLRIHRFTSPFTVYQGSAFNYFINELTIPGYNSVQKDTEFTITNTASPSPIYIYFIRYTNHSEPYLVPWEPDPSNEDDSDVIERDMQGEYFGSGVTYLATDGETTYWVEEASIDGEWLHSDAVALMPGESVTFTLPHDGSDSFYHLQAEAYYPEYDYYYWLYATIRVSE